MIHLLLLAAATLSQPSIPPHLLTTAERSNFTATARHAEVVALLDALSASDPRATRISLGTTREGRDLPMLLLADPPVFAPADLQRPEHANKAVVFVIGNIHGGEVCGKEALPILAREMLAAGGADADILQHVVLALAPIYNADGNERVGMGNRPGQNGPAEAGVRHNAMDLDLNRDFIKVEAPETAGLVRFLNNWNPHLFIDTHTTNGSYHRFVISYAGPKSLAGNPGVLSYTRGKFLPGVAAAYTANTGQPTFHYGSFGGGVFNENADEKTRWGTFPAEARFGTTYVGLRGRLSLLSEAYVYAPFQERVERTRDFVRSAVRWTAEHREEVRALAAAADAEDWTEITLRSRLVECEGDHTILGFEEEVGEAGRVNTGRPRDYSVKLVDCFQPELTVKRPRAYVLPPDARLAPIVAKLQQHGVRVERLSSETNARCEIETVASATPQSRPFQGHVLVKVETRVREENRTLPRGSWTISTSQPLGRLASYMLEARSEDGLTTWNFMDAWLMEGEEYPVMRWMNKEEAGPGS